MAQAIKYQTTTIAAEKTVGEIGVIVQRYGGSRFEQRWDNTGRLAGIRFAIRTDLGEVPVSMSAKIDRIADVLFGKTTMGKDRARDQAYRIAWRHIKDLTEQLLLAVELGLRDIGSAFMADIEVWDDVQLETVTMAEFLNRRAVFDQGEHGLRLLPASETAKVHQLTPGRDVG